MEGLCGEFFMVGSYGGGEEKFIDPTLRMAVEGWFACAETATPMGVCECFY